MGWLERDRVVGVHIRRGDSCVDVDRRDKFGTCAEVREYMAAADKIRRLYGISAMYLATVGGREAEKGAGARGNQNLLTSIHNFTTRKPLL
jgi:hypothetical protein